MNVEKSYCYSIHNKQFKHRQGLYRHKKTVCGKSDKLCCTKCSKVMYRKDYLDLH